MTLIAGYIPPTTVEITSDHGRIGRLWWTNSNQIYPKGSREVMWGKFGFDGTMIFRWEQVK